MKEARIDAVREAGIASLAALVAEHSKLRYTQAMLDHHFQRIMREPPKGTPRWVKAYMSGYWRYALDNVLGKDKL